MDRLEFLRRLRQMWSADGELSEPLTIDDLLDDAATLGVRGASEMYAILLRDALEHKG